MAKRDKRKTVRRAEDKNTKQEIKDQFNPNGGDLGSGKTPHDHYEQGYQEGRRAERHAIEHAANVRANEKSLLFVPGGDIPVRSVDNELLIARWQKHGQAVARLRSELQPHDEIFLQLNREMIFRGLIDRSKTYNG